MNASKAVGVSFLILAALLIFDSFAFAVPCGPTQACPSGVNTTTSTITGVSTATQTYATTSLQTVVTTTYAVSTSGTTTTTTATWTCANGTYGPYCGVCASAITPCVSSSTSVATTTPGTGNVQVRAVDSNGNLLAVAVSLGSYNGAYGSLLVTTLPYGTYTVNCATITGYGAPTYSPSNVVTLSSPGTVMVTCTYPQAPAKGTITVNVIDQYGNAVGAAIYLNGLYIGSGFTSDSAVVPGAYTVSCGAAIGTSSSAVITPSPSVTVTPGSTSTVVCTYQVPYGSGGCNYYVASTNTCYSQQPSGQGGQYAQGIVRQSLLFGSNPPAVGGIPFEFFIAILTASIGILLLIRREAT